MKSRHHQHGPLRLQKKGERERERQRETEKWERKTMVVLELCPDSKIIWYIRATFIGKIFIIRPRGSLRGPSGVKYSTDCRRYNFTSTSEIAGIVMTCHEFHESHEVSWDVMRSHEMSWEITTSHEMSWGALRSYVVSWDIPRSHEILWTCVGDQWISKIWISKICI